jgi:hypothetical protein
VDLHECRHDRSVTVFQEYVFSLGIRIPGICWTYLVEKLSLARSYLEASGFVGAAFMPARPIAIISLTSGGHKARPYERLAGAPGFPDENWL